MYDLFLYLRSGWEHCHARTGAETTDEYVEVIAKRLSQVREVAL
jgi:hypothetical protein